MSPTSTAKRLFFPALALFLAACGTTNRYLSGVPESAPIDSVQGLEEDYSVGRHDRFFERFAAGRFLKYAAFQLNVRERWKRNPFNIPLQIHVDRVVWKSDEVVVQVHWDRKSVDETGRLKQEQGSCDLAFDTEMTSGFLPLKAVLGDSPF